MENPIQDVKSLKHYILNSVNNARLMVTERELNEFSNNAKAILIEAKGNDRLREILCMMKTRFDETNLTKVHRILYSIFYNPNSSNELKIRDVNLIRQFFDSLTELTSVFGLYQNEQLGDAIELIILFE